ncbi:HAD-IA family hydrolase [Candidatus Kaiserbacteria bacterium]|nr:HAD-IA family hydrolase [Candidatus Kaiserbacteria bacterium]
MGKHFILFDFDGVILDSYKIAFAAQNVVCPDCTEEQYRQLFEGNIFEQISMGSIHTNRCHHADFWDHYIPQLKDEGTLVPGMDAVISALAEVHRMIIVSSGQTPFIENFLAENALLEYFSAILGNNVHKSKEEKIRMVFETHGVSASDCVFVTDTVGDVREADKMGVGAIGVTWGYHEPERFSKVDHFRLVHTPESLPSAIDDYFARTQTSVSIR